MDKWWDRRSKEQVRQEWWNEVTDPASYIAAAILRLGDRSEFLAQRVGRIFPALVIVATFGGVLIAQEPRLQIGDPVAFAIALVATGTATLLPGQVEWLRHEGQLPGTGYPRRFRKWLWAIEAVAFLVITAAQAFPHEEPAHSVTVAVASVCLADLSVPVVCWGLLWGIDARVGPTLRQATREGDHQVAPSANVRLLRSIYATWERRNFRSARWAHPTIGFQVADGPSVSSGTGVAGLKEAWRGWLRAWTQFQAVAYKFVVLDDERVQVLVDFSEPREVSGVADGEVRTKWMNLFHVRQGKVTRLVIDDDPDRALSDLALPSEGDRPA
jgi:hypothetical protein